jgi:hypothetical protein
MLMADKPEPESTARVSAARKRLWTAISDYVHGQGGWVTSPPYSRFLRIEVEQGSSLPVQLEKAGHSLRRAGITTRSGPGFRTVDVWNWIYQEGNR